MKESKDILKWGKIKPFFDTTYHFNTIDIETVDNELFLFGYTENDNYEYTLNNFYKSFNDFLIRCIQTNHDILTWSRYDNTHLVKLLLSKISCDDEKTKILLRIGKITPIFSYEYRKFKITIENIIKDSIVFKVEDRFNSKPKRLVIYNLKNLYTSDLLKTAQNYKLDYYSKLGIEYHIIDKSRFNSDSEYKRMVVYSNELDNRVIKDIANLFLKDFKDITGVFPKSIYTAGSIARSYLLTQKDKIDVNSMNFKSLFARHELFEELLDFSMKSYHGGKIESYIIGYIPHAKMIDITSAYPYALSLLPKLTNKVSVIKGNEVKKILDNYFYAFINCNIVIDNQDFIHPLVVRSPINLTNLSPYGYLKDVTITKPEYDYLVQNNVKIDIIETVLIEHIENVFPYRELVYNLFNSRMSNIKTNLSKSLLFKDISNSLYGITFELTDLYIESEENEIEWKGYRAGDFFNPVIASYLTAMTRTYLSMVSYNIICNGGEVYLNMTDSIIYKGDVTLDVFSDVKTLGKFEPPDEIKDVIILGAGRYEYKNEFNNKYTIKNRGFSIKVKDKGFYNNLDLNSEIIISNKTFVSSFRATTNKYSFKDMGHLIDDEYNINPFNLGGKRVIENNKINLNKDYTKTKPIYLDEYL